MSAISPEPIQRLTRDLCKAASSLSRQEVRYLVDSYYQIQELRKASHNQVRALLESGEPHELLRWFGDNSELLESQIRRGLQAYAESQRLGAWCLAQIGIGPVITAGLLAHIDIEKAPSVGNIWSFAGLAVGQEWRKGQKRPWNAQLKTLCWKAGQCFLKTSNHEESFYGRLLRERWEFEKQRNDSGALAAQAAAKLERFKINKSTDAFAAYSVGKLPPAHILQRACRWSVKLFLSHYFWVAYEIHYGSPPPNPYVHEHLGHVHIIPPPHWP